MVEEKIPAYPMWKMFSDTLSELLKADLNEASFGRMAGIIKSEEFGKIFIYERENHVSVSQYHETISKYRTFNTWFLGHFFYLLCSDKLVKFHEFVTQTQLTTLRQLCHTHMDIFRVVCFEYGHVLDCLAKHSESEQEQQLVAFEPSPDELPSLELRPINLLVSRRNCSSLTIKLLPLLEFILNRHFTLKADAIVQSMLKHLVMLAQAGSVSLPVKCQIAYLMTGLMEYGQPQNFNVRQCFYVFVDFFEVFIQTYWKQLRSTFDTLTSILCRLFRFYWDGHTLRVLTTYLMNQSEYDLDSELRLHVLKYARQCSDNFELEHWSSFKLCSWAIHCFYGQIKNEIDLKLSSELSSAIINLSPVCSPVVHKLFTSISIGNFQTICTYFNEFCHLLIDVQLEYQDRRIVFLDLMQSDQALLNAIISAMSTYISSENCRILSDTLRSLPLVSGCPLELARDVIDTFNMSPSMHLSGQFINMAKKMAALQYCETGKFETVIYWVRYLVSMKFLYEDHQDFVECICSIMENLLIKYSKDVSGRRQQAMEVLPYYLLLKRSNADNVLKPYMRAGDINTSLVAMDVPTIQMFQRIICIMDSSAAISRQRCHIRLDTNKIDITLVCNKCTKSVGENANHKLDFIYPPVFDTILNSMKHVCSVLTSSSGNMLNDNAVDEELLLTSIPVLVTCSNHMIRFHADDHAKIWIHLMAHPKECVREELSRHVLRLARNQFRWETDANCMTSYFWDTTLNITKDSMRHCDFELQDTVVMTLQNLVDLFGISEIGVSEMQWPMIRILIYLIMTPTSKHSFVAVHLFHRLAEKCDIGAMDLYKRHKFDISALIVHLCIVNYKLLKFTLLMSLSKMAMAMQFHSAKSYLQRDSQYLLPLLVAKAAHEPCAIEHINEIAKICDCKLNELIGAHYGKIFVHCYIRESVDEYSKCMRLLDEWCDASGTALRKQNFNTILNELLFHFHDKHDKVLQMLMQLKNEDTASTSLTVPDFLQTRLLGLLQHFDFKLIDPNRKVVESVLRSLADLLRFMGARHISPLRFKLIAMLRTDRCNNEIDLSVLVWEAFIKSCDVPALGGQLATIFVSLMPLLQNEGRRLAAQVNHLFKYLVVQNETHLKQHIQDLFFVLDCNEHMDADVVHTIKAHTNTLLGSDATLRTQIQFLVPYLRHETVEVRLHSCQHLRRLIEVGREQLDAMILGYNGMDMVLSDLVGELMLLSSNRQHDQKLRLACGHLLGALAAIEPSIFPRRPAQTNSKFTFYMTDDFFIVNTLTELIQALQRETNTYSMDRFSIAIQEILRAYKISPDNERIPSLGDMKGHLWKEFSASQQQVMQPLLSSKYIIKQKPSGNYPCPIYGNADYGSTFKEWLYKWTCNLTLKLQQKNRANMTVCLPAMKQDQRVLMHFLPYIWLHALIENEQARTDALIELKAIFNSSKDTTGEEGCERTNHVLRQIGWVQPRCGAITPADSLPSSGQTENTFHEQATRTAFLLLDFLDRWLRETQHTKGMLVHTLEEYGIINEFLKTFCKYQLARCSFQCGDYTRALRYLEDYMSTRTTSEQIADGSLALLMDVYGRLDESDGVAGCMALQSGEPALEQRILALEVSGKLWDAIACYESLKQPLSMHHLKGLVRCCLDLGNVNMALNLTSSALADQPIFDHELLELRAEPLYRLSRYEELESALEADAYRAPTVTSASSSACTCWCLGVGKALLAMSQVHEDRSRFATIVQQLRIHQVDQLSSLGLHQQDAIYHNGYAIVGRLHTIMEMEQMEQAIFYTLAKPASEQDVSTIMQRLATSWELRIKVVQESLKIIEPILCMRRVFLERAKSLLSTRCPIAVPHIDRMLGECWLQSARIARKAAMHQQAFTYTIEAEAYRPPRLFIERAKLHWLREEHEQSLVTLNRGMERLQDPPNRGAQSTISERTKMMAEAKLLFATYNDRISNVDSETNLRLYKQSCETLREWERSWVSLGQYYDRMFQSRPNNARDVDTGCDMQLNMIICFGKSLRYGSSYVYQSVPRMLSIWLDFGSRLFQTECQGPPPTPKPATDVEQQLQQRKSILKRMTQAIHVLVNDLPPYIFLTAFSQLVSRICHPQKEVYIQLKAIIVKLIVSYPQQCLWMIISVMKSAYVLRTKRCAEIFADKALKEARMTKLIEDFTDFAKKLIDLCNKEIAENVTSTSVSQLVRALPRKLSSPDFSRIMIPTQKMRKLILPNPNTTTTDGSAMHNPFPNQYVYIESILEEVIVLHSLQRPRRITFLGSDGNRYIQMLKPKDDLRKDFRLMEFNDIVNHLLSRDPASRQRRLNIRTYSVVPLNEECGLIEWVPNLLGLRPILMSLYKQRGCGMTLRELKEKSCNKVDPFDKKRRIFEKIIMPRHPPVLGEWFRHKFPDAQSWLTARTAYIHTTAVMSMVGYILGLGDRHGENILFDAQNGDTVHVDFNCLFNKGETFDWPERVPFRLTHNMVSAMGPLGVEGMFRKSCACALQVLRTNSDTLMCIVTPFVYDPLVNWSGTTAGMASSSAHNSAAAAERTNEQALEHIKNIALRLKGVVKTRTVVASIPLSVDGQTNCLIKDAMDIDNLCQMFIGWGAFL